MAAFSSLIPGVQRAVTTELCKDAGAPLLNTFLNVLILGRSSGSSQGM